MMGEKQYKILLIEDNPGDSRLIQEALREVSGVDIELVKAELLATGLEILAEDDIEVVLLDLTLPDSMGLETLDQVRLYAPEAPVVVLTGLDDEDMALKAVQAGAQDYLVKGQVDGTSLVRAIRYAVERHRVQSTLHNLSLIDELTGLYNRRGFKTLGEHQIKLANRREQELFLIYADLDGMKQINDTYGHQEGDLALAVATSAFRDIFRTTDIIARIGGDEFAVLMLDTSEEFEMELIQQRLEEKLGELARTKEQNYRLSVSIGMARYDGKQPCALKELVARADALMYQQKRLKKQQLAHE